MVGGRHAVGRAGELRAKTDEPTAVYVEKCNAPGYGSAGRSNVTCALQDLVRDGLPLVRGAARPHENAQVPRSTANGRTNKDRDVVD